MYLSNLNKKSKEAILAVLPIMAVVIVLSVTVVPMPAGIMLSFIFGGVLVILGMMFFSLGAELAMETMGEKLGSKITKTKKLWLILIVGFFLGVMITIAEPDLMVLGGQVQEAIGKWTLIFSVAAGVGIFLILSFLRMAFTIPLRTVLLISYAIVLILGIFFVPKNFLSIAFDSGGVTTGPMTVPFIMAFGVGITAIRNDRHAKDDSFGTIALCSVGPILAVMILSIIFKPENIANTSYDLPNVSETVQLGELFVSNFPTYLGELAISLLPIVAFFAVAQLIRPNIDRHTAIRVLIGTAYTYGGLVLFMTGVNVGFMPAGTFLGQELAGLPMKWIIIPIGMLVGFFIVNAEPAVYVLMRQVEELTNGAVKGKTLKWSLCLSVALSVGLSMLRILTGISIIWFVVPGYLLALALSFVTPKVFTAIAFDSGGVASGPMTTTFLLPFAMGACIALGGNITKDAFGVVAMVAMTPVITIQILGIIAKFSEKKQKTSETVEDLYAEYDNFAIIEL